MDLVTILPTHFISYGPEHSLLIQYLFINLYNHNRNLNHLHYHHHTTPTTTITITNTTTTPTTITTTINKTTTTTPMPQARKIGMNPLKSTVLKWGCRLSPKTQRCTKKTNKVALLKVFPNELEDQVRQEMCPPIDILLNFSSFACLAALSHEY